MMQPVSEAITILGDVRRQAKPRAEIMPQSYQ